MKILKLYEEFWGSKSDINEDLEFDFLAAVGRCKNAINKVVEVHENHYYNDNKIVSSESFQSELKSFIDGCLQSKGGMDQLLDLVKKYEQESYNDDKFEIDSDNDYAMFGIFEDLCGFLSAAVREKTQRNVDYLNNESQDILDNCDETWITQENMRDSIKTVSDVDLDDFEDDSSDMFSRWETSEGLQEDLERYIGKSLGDFEYGDKLRAYKYVSENETIKYILEEGDEQEIQQVTSFLNSLKEFFEL